MDPDHVRHDFEVGAADVDAFLRAAAQHEEGDDVHRQTDDGDCRDGKAGNLGRIREAAGGLVKHPPGDCEEQDRIGQCRKHFRAVHAESTVGAPGGHAVRRGSRRAP